MKVKSIIKLGIVMLLIVVVAFLALNGLNRSACRFLFHAPSVEQPQPEYRLRCRKSCGIIIKFRKRRCGGAFTGIR